MNDLISLRRADDDVRVADFDHAAWRKAPAVRLTRYYSGETAPAERHAEARLLWTSEALYVRFQSPQAEPLVVSDAPQMRTKTIGLWDRDVCEIFVAPDAETPARYFEFEAAPTGEWLDLAIHWKPDGRVTDWDYDSGMQAAGRIGTDGIEVLMCLPWRAFGREPRSGDVWLVNLFRIVGRDTEATPRGYVAWQPTYTSQPNFHVPAAFGRLVFTHD